MAKVYRAIQLWEQWLTHFLGKSVLETEQRALASLLDLHYGKHALLIGVPEQHILLNASNMSCDSVLGPLINRNKNITYIEGELYELPILSGSVDMVILPHSLEYIDNPHQLITEACRVVKPEGHIFILGFNPYSLWGLKKKWTHHKTTPWSSHFLHVNTIKKWLSLADFELVNQKMLLFRPPILNQKLFQKLKFLEWIGSKCYNPFGSIYLLKAKAKVIPLTPIRLHWKQELSGVPLSSTILPGSSIRTSR